MYFEFTFTVKVLAFNEILWALSMKPLILKIPIRHWKDLFPNIDLANWWNCSWVWKIIQAVAEASK